MLFTTLEFLAFFLLYFVLHLMLPERYRLWLVILGSTVFYSGWNIYYVWLPHFLMAIAYVGVRWMERSGDDRQRKSRMRFTLLVLFLPLIFFKYTNFLLVDVFHLSRQPVLHLGLPLGISFITFTMTAYVIDVFRKKFPVENNAGMLSGLVLFFPHLIAGPILRPHELIPQFKQKLDVWRAPFLLGFTFFTLGMLKKLVFADIMATDVDRVYQATKSGLSAMDFSAIDLSTLSKLDYILAVYGFTLQIYCDFSGYTDMAIGLALILGIHLPVNFNSPFCSVSFLEFWSRWHITLSTWFRDYVFFPMGKSRWYRTLSIWLRDRLFVPLGGTLEKYPLHVGSVMMTMLLAGLWHGAQWTYVAWGGFHGVVLIIAHVMKKFSEKYIPLWLSVVITFHTAVFSLIIFRASSFGQISQILEGLMFSPWGDIAGFISLHIFPFILLAVFLLTHRWDNYGSVERVVSRLPKAVLFPGLLLAWLLAITLSQGNSEKFIYFDF